MSWAGHASSTGVDRSHTSAHLLCSLPGQVSSLQLCVQLLAPACSFLQLLLVQSQLPPELGDTLRGHLFRPVNIGAHRGEPGLQLRPLCLKSSLIFFQSAHLLQAKKNTNPSDSEKHRSIRQRCQKGAVDLGYRVH